jgi:hypothetical protein
MRKVLMRNSFVGMLAAITLYAQSPNPLATAGNSTPRYTVTDLGTPLRSPRRPGSSRRPGGNRELHT